MFAISTRIRYGLRSLVALALNTDNGPVPINSIAEKEDISRKYLENIFKLFKRSGIVSSIRGPSGGYKLSISTADITLFSLIEALEGPVNPINCITDPVFCNRTEFCGTKELWMDYQSHIEEYLKSMTLEQVIDKYYRR